MGDILTGKKHFSILFPKEDTRYNVMSGTTWHDLGFDVLVKKLTLQPQEQTIIMKVMTNMTDDPEVSRFRLEVFRDILEHPRLRKRMMELLGHINHLLDFSSMRRSSYDDDTASIWDLMHRLDDINDYIMSVEAIHDCLSEPGIRSAGLTGLREYADSLYSDNGFDALKKDISELKATTSTIRSVTLGVNLNSRFEAEAIGLVSINRKPFTKAPLLSNFSGALVRRDIARNTEEWNGDMTFHQVSEGDLHSGELQDVARMKALMVNPIMTIGMTNVSRSDTTMDMPRYLDRIANHMLFQTSRKLREVLDRYVTISVYEFTSLIPEFMYYIRWAEYVLARREQGYLFCLPEVAGTEDTTAVEDAKTVEDGEARLPRSMDAVGFYNMKLIDEVPKPSDIVHNELFFDDEHQLFLLTGANRGGKTTVTQAIGQLFVMAQGGIAAPAGKFVFKPVDCIYTHFPADEDKTMDLGRLGEECQRFKDIYAAATDSSLLLLNETFSTTSFDEGYFIAADAVRALLSKGVRTLFNTHMHKLAYDIDSFNGGSDRYKCSSLIVQTSLNGVRSYRVAVAPPDGSSYAADIARKYGVTFEQLTESGLTKMS